MAWNLMRRPSHPTLGCPATTGSNVLVGSLGRFLEAAKTGQVTPGSHLLVESLDRLSRQELERSMSIFLEIINNGIVLVTLSDQQEYRSGKTDLGKMIGSLAIMSRSHNESFEKANRLKASWSRKRETISEQKLTAMCPSWLK